MGARCIMHVGGSSDSWTLAVNSHSQSVLAWSFCLWGQIHESLRDVISQAAIAPQGSGEPPICAQKLANISWSLDSIAVAPVGGGSPLAVPRIVSNSTWSSQPSLSLASTSWSVSYLPSDNEPCSPAGLSPCIVKELSKTIWTYFYSRLLSNLEKVSSRCPQDLMCDRDPEPEPSPRAPVPPEPEPEPAPKHLLVLCSVSEVLEKEARKDGWTADSVDVVNGDDLRSESLRRKLRQSIRSGYYRWIHAAPPCTTYCFGYVWGPGWQT